MGKFSVEKTDEDLTVRLGDLREKVRSLRLTDFEVLARPRLLLFLDFGGEKVRANLDALGVPLRQQTRFARIFDGFIDEQRGLIFRDRGGKGDAEVG